MWNFLLAKVSAYNVTYIDTWIKATTWITEFSREARGALTFRTAGLGDIDAGRTIQAGVGSIASIVTTLRYGHRTFWTSESARACTSSACAYLHVIDTSPSVNTLLIEHIQTCTARNLWNMEHTVWVNHSEVLQLKHKHVTVYCVALLFDIHIIQWKVVSVLRYTRGRQPSSWYPIVF